MLDSLIIEAGYAIAYGSGSLKALQNDSIPELDLLVREAVQNSSDASLNELDDSFCVNFNTGTFKPHQFNVLLKDLTTVLDNRYSGDNAEYLEIRDYKTSGLTGTVRLSELDQDDHGNFFKLVFDTGKEQTNGDNGNAGGSWGYGKSVYYRVGMGIVVFYSQIRKNSGFESRLIISLIERETDANALLREISPLSTGRAWWGFKDISTNDMLPITDQDVIQEILDIFSIEPFKQNQTGTAVIIPYIDRNSLLKGIIPEDSGLSDEDSAMCVWKDDLSKYIELALQKWYAPKIFNKHLKAYSNQKWLAARVEKKPIRFEDMRPLFQLVQELYTTALSYNSDVQPKYESDIFGIIKCNPVRSSRLKKIISGHVAVVKITKEELSPTGASISPYNYLRKFNKSVLNDPIIMFARNPGMILEYKTDDRWTKGLAKPENDNEYILGFYVPDCSNNIKVDFSDNTFAGMSLGEYLRSCEKSDHTDWEDKSSVLIVDNIKVRMVEQVNKITKETESTPVEGTASKLSGKLGRRLLPSLKFRQHKKGGGTGGSGGGGGSVSDNFEFTMETPSIHKDKLVIQFSMKFKNNRKSAYIGLFVESETGLLDAEAWKNDIGTRFPLTITSIEKCSVHSENLDRTLEFSHPCTKDNICIANDFSNISIIMGDDGLDTVGFSVTNTITNAVISAQFIIKTADKKYCCTIKESKKSI